MWARRAPQPTDEELRSPAPPPLSKDAIDLVNVVLRKPFCNLRALWLHLDSHTRAATPPVLGGGRGGVAALLPRGAALASRGRGERVHTGHQPLPLGQRGIRTAPGLACPGVLIVRW